MFMNVHEHLSMFNTWWTSSHRGKSSPLTVRNYVQKLVQTSDVNNLFRSFYFRDFLEKHLQFFIRYLMGISKYSQNAI